MEWRKGPQAGGLGLPCLQLLYHLQCEKKIKAKVAPRPVRFANLAIRVSKDLNSLVS
jgi:hypothetical protein